MPKELGGKMANRNAIAGLMLALMIFTTGFTEKDSVSRITTDGTTVVQNEVSNLDESTNDENGIYAHITTNDSVRHMVNHPALRGFGRYLLPWDNGTDDYDKSLNHVGLLLPYHSHVDSNIVVDAINHMIDEVKAGKTIFYDFYTEQQKQANPSKASTGLFFFKGKPGAPFAIVCPGGGFSYVGSLHEGFPHAMVLSKRGYNAFVLKYRVGSGLRATEDLAEAISFIFKNSDVFEIGIGSYSLWGSSAGPRMVGNIALTGTAGFGGYGLPKPRIVVIAYTGHTSFSENYPPTFITVSEDDRIVNVSAVDRRVENLRNAGIEVEYRKFKNAGHGFGLGVGTDAEGWIEHAIDFWESHMPE
jgi:acetyl esterase/lipase